MLLGAKKTAAQLEYEKELERAWAIYGQEVEDFLNNANIDEKFEQLERVTRPKLKLQVLHKPLSEDLKQRVERGEIQSSKAHRFMTDPELGKMLVKQEQSAPNRLTEDLKQRVERGEIQGSKAHRFMTDPNSAIQVNIKYPAP